MKLLRLCFVLLLMSVGFSACEVQGNVVDIVEGTPSNAKQVLPDKFEKHAPSDSLKKETKEEHLLPEFKK